MVCKTPAVEQSRFDTYLPDNTTTKSGEVLVKKFGIQQFLNHVHSGASGYVKFAIRPEKRDGAIGIEAEAQLADCTNKIYLEFEPRSLYPSRGSAHNGDTRVYDKVAILKSKSSIRHMRQKVDKFRRSVVSFCNAMDESLDEMERQIDAIPPTLIYDSRKEK